MSENYTWRSTIAAVKRQYEDDHARTSKISPPRTRARPTGGKTGRPRDEALILAVEEIFAYIENSDDCQFTLGELKNVCKNSNIDNRTVKLRLKLTLNRAC
ncbi:unnamed protein product [Euphydryas editha]|uniref:Uncharacterized protein n=1 Tax=Euphydryas editha TaxID=104508 RepID=A0AAU9U3X0_EUPED|nr:unnamed protein product [Euphydryas editha]